MYSPAPIEWLQQFSTPWLDALFVLVTSVGSAPFYLAAVAFIYLAVDRRAGVVVGFAMLFTGFSNLALKFFFGHPRPPSDLWKVVETDPGFPSGHAQTSATFWPLVAWRFPAPWLMAVSALMVLLVSASRVYLGVHFALQVVAGAAAGLVVAAAAVVLEPPVARWVARLPLRGQLAVATVAPLALLAAYRGPHAFEFAGGMVGLGVGYALERWRLGPAPAPQPTAGFVAGGMTAFVASAAALLLLPEAWPWLLLRGFALTFVLAFVVPAAHHRLTRA